MYKPRHVLLIFLQGGALLGVMATYTPAMAQAHDLLARQSFEVQMSILVLETPGFSSIACSGGLSLDLDCMHSYSSPVLVHVDQCWY
jgi:hypothetical protein